MGYESRLYLVKTTNQICSNTNKKYAMILAMFNLGKLCWTNNFLKLLENSPITTYFIFGDDGDTPILKDSYGDELKEINIDELIEVIEEIQNNAINSSKSHYSTIAALLFYLNQIIKIKYVDFKILHYGH